MSLTKAKTVSIPNVYFVPGVMRNLLSMSEATKNGTTIQFDHNLTVIRHKLPNGEMLKNYMSKIRAAVPVTNGQQNPNIRLICIKKSRNWSYFVVAPSIGHLNPKSMKIGQVHKLFEGVPTKPFDHISLCEGCIYGKKCRQKFPVCKRKRTERPLQLIHSDLCGPIPTLSIRW